MQDIHTSCDVKEHVGLMFFDLSKAFDTVWHGGLLAKLELSFLVHGPALQWLSSYLSCRRQTVRVSGTLSDPLVAQSGVPQGSILGPFLFLAHVNDLPQQVSGVSLFADDTALMCTDRSSDGLAISMQHGTNTIVSWMESWQLKPNLAKTEAMYVSPSPPAQPLHFPGHLTPILIVDQHKHLGAIIDSQLSWSQQVSYVWKRASHAVVILQRHCQYLPDRCNQLFLRPISRPYLTIVILLGVAFQNGFFKSYKYISAYS